MHKTMVVIVAITTLCLSMFYAHEARSSVKLTKQQVASVCGKDIFTTKDGKFTGCEKKCGTNTCTYSCNNKATTETCGAIVSIVVHEGNNSFQSVTPQAIMK